MKFGKVHDFVKLCQHVFLGEAQHSAVEEDVFPCGKVHIKACAQLDKRSDGAVDCDFAPCRLENPCNSLEKCGFARAVDAYKTVEVAFFDIKAYAVQRPEFFKVESAFCEFEKIFLK